MPEVWFAIPGDIETRTGGYIYARRLLEQLPGTGWTPLHLPLADGFPDPTGAELADAKARLRALPRGALVLVDGLAFGVLEPDFLERLGHRWVALVHHPLALETGIDSRLAERLRQSEKKALAVARAVIVTSAHTAKLLANEYNVAGRRITIALPGVEPAKRARGGNAPPDLLTVASITPRKGFDILLTGLATIKDLAWRSHVVGSLARDPGTVEMVRRLLGELGLSERVTLAGELTGADLDRAYASADVFVLPSRYEGYGMAFAEALAHGLPVVACRAGAVADTVPATAGLLVPVDDAPALAAALRRLLTEPDLRRRLADSAWAHGRSLQTWADTARQVAAALSAVAS